MAATCKHSLRVIPGTERSRGRILLPDADMALYLNPLERTLFCLFLAHPEGIPADNLLLYWQELRTLYERESRFDDDDQRKDVLETLCAESKTEFYTTVSRIKRKFVSALGARKAAPYIIKRDKNGIYKTRARLADFF